MRKKLSGFVLGAILLHFGFGALAQGYVESALLFSRTRPGGSARIQGAGGAQIALGGDYSSALSNPATRTRDLGGPLGTQAFAGVVAEKIA